MKVKTFISEFRFTTGDINSIKTSFDQEINNWLKGLEAKNIKVRIVHVTQMFYTDRAEKIYLLTTVWHEAEAAG